MLLLPAEKKDSLAVFSAGNQIHHFLIHRKEKPVKSFTFYSNLLQHIIRKTAILHKTDAVLHLLRKHIRRAAKTFQQEKAEGKVPAIPAR